MNSGQEMLLEILTEKVILAKHRFCPVSAADSVNNLLAEIEQVLLTEYDDRLIAETEQDLLFRCI